MTENSLHRVALKNDDVASAGSNGVGGSRLVRPQARYVGGLAGLYYRAVTELHKVGCDRNIARFHHHLTPVGIGRVVLCLQLLQQKYVIRILFCIHQQ